MLKLVEVKALIEKALDEFVIKKFQPYLMALLLGVFCLGLWVCMLCIMIYRVIRMPYLGLKENHLLRVRVYLCGCRILLLIAFLAPFSSLLLFANFRPAGEGLGQWFSRSGAVTTIYSLLAITASQECLRSLNRPGFLGDIDLLDLFNRYEKKFTRIDNASLLMTLAGTVVWGYGDVILNSISS